MTSENQWTTHSPDETRRVARDLATRMQPGSVVALVGDLGAGKTCFVQGLADALGITEPVTSPTYNLIQEYFGQQPLVHADLYRTSGPDEVWELGLQDYWDNGALVAIEWPHYARNFLPTTTWWVELDHGQTNEERIVRVRQEVTA